MKNIIQNIQNQIKDIANLRYVDEDWGQLDYYSPNFPVQWPCVLIDINDVNYSNIGRDKTKTPVNRQMADVVCTLKVANLRLTNTSAKAPQNQKDNVWSIFNLLEEVHKKLQGFNPSAESGSLIRIRQSRQFREDGVQVYLVSYRFSQNNI